MTFDNKDKSFKRCHSRLGYLDDIFQVLNWIWLGVCNYIACVFGVESIQGGENK